MILQPSQALLVTVFAWASVCLAGTPAEEAAITSQKEREALIAFLKMRGVDLRVAGRSSNVISHMYSVGPEHEKKYLVGLTYHAQGLSDAEVIAKYSIALPFVINNHWVLWRVGGPRGNATKDYLVVWERVCNAFEAYVPDTQGVSWSAQVCW